MSKFKPGKFDRKSMGLVRHFAPIQAVHTIEEISAADLVGAGKKLVLVDVDNTLVGWHSHEIPESTHEWLQSLKEAQLAICILSNTRKPARLDRLAKEMDIPYLRGRFKPSRRMYRTALEKFGFSPEQTVMIGDQLFTDIWGANRTGIDSIWVRQMTPKDFVGTKVSRLGERIIQGRIHRAIIDEAAVVDSATLFSPESVLARPALRQFGKFLIVGGSSTIIDWGLTWVLKYHVTVGGKLMSEELGAWLIHNVSWPFGLYDPRFPGDAAIPLIKGFSTTIAGINSFIFNRRWTFNITGTTNRQSHVNRFILVNVVGLLLNMGLTSAFDQLLPGSDKQRLLFAMVLATGAVTLWNFFGQKHWAFREKD
jgi:hypothetical protein